MGGYRKVLRGTGPTLPGTATSVIYLWQEIIDGKMAQIKGNVCFLALYYSIHRHTHMKAYMPCPYHWGR